MTTTERQAIIAIIAHALKGRMLANRMAGNGLGVSFRTGKPDGAWVRGGCYGGFETAIVEALQALGYPKSVCEMILWDEFGPRISETSIYADLHEMSELVNQVLAQSRFKPEKK